MVALYLIGQAVPEGLPMWVVLVGMVLGGGSIVAVFQYLTQRNETKAGHGVAVAVARKSDVDALAVAIESLSGENSRLAGRVGTLDARIHELASQLDRRNDQIDLLKAELDRRPTREELIEQLATLRQQIVALGEIPINGT